MKFADMHDAFLKRRTFGFFDDFEWFITAHRWASLASDSGASVAHSDARGGKVVLTTGGTDNNEALLKSATECVLWAADKGSICEARIQYSEANTDDANVCFGLADAMGANLMVDDGAGPKTSFSGALIYKKDGGTVWRCMASNGSTQSDSVSTTTAGGSSDQVLTIIANSVGTNMEILYQVDGVYLVDSNGVVIKHTVAVASLTEMQIGAYVKAGGSNSEVLTVDYIGLEHTR